MISTPKIEDPEFLVPIPNMIPEDHPGECLELNSNSAASVIAAAAGTIPTCVLIRCARSLRSTFPFFAVDFSLLRPY